MFNNLELQNVVVDLHNRVILQAYKIGLINNFKYYQYGEESNIDKLDKIILELNNKHKISIDFPNQELRECSSFYSLVNENF